MIEHWRMFAAYNAWANRRLYAACAALAPEDLERDGGAFFVTISATLNHLLVTDRIWIARFLAEPAPPYALDTVLYADFQELTRARAAEDRRIVDFVSGLGEDAAARPLVYRRQTSPDEIRQTLAQALAHLFNHQTHHRGQTHAMLTQFAGSLAGPPLDLAFFQRGVGVD